MANLLLIFVCLAAGVILRRAGRFNDTAAGALGTFVIYLSLPALVLTQVPALVASSSSDGSVLVPISMAWIAFVVAFGLLSWLGRRFRWSRATTGALILTVGLGNTSFVGYPLIETLLGAPALRFAVLVDQPGSFLVLSTLGLATASFFSPPAPAASSSDAGTAVETRGAPDDQRGLRAMARRILTFPPLIALVTAAIWGASGTYRPGTALGLMLDKLAATLVPVALVTVGMQIRVDPTVLRQRWRPLALGLALKLVVLPVLFLGLYVYVCSARGLAVHVTVLQSAMSPMITSAVLVAEFGLDAELAGLMLGVGIPLSLLTVPLWNFLLKTMV